MKQECETKSFTHHSLNNHGKTIHNTIICAPVTSKSVVNPWKKMESNQPVSQSFFISQNKKWSLLILKTVKETESQKRLKHVLVKNN